MKKLFLVMVMLGGLVSGAFADIDTYNGRVIFVKNFYQNSKLINDYMKQEVTGASNACGPTSLSYIVNHFYKEQSGVSLVDSYKDGTDLLKRIYKNIDGVSYNGITSLDQLKVVAKSWNFNSTTRMSANNSITKNANYLIDHIKNNKPALVVLDSDFEGNPVKNTKDNQHNIDHIVIVYAYKLMNGPNGFDPDSRDEYDRQNDRIYFYDPYKGGNGYFVRKDIQNAINLTGFAFLVIAP